MILANPTPFVAHRFIVLDKSGAENLVVMLKATYAIGEGRRLAPAPVQRPIQFVDEYHGEPGLSSIRLPSEGLPPKPGTDVLLVGDARAPREGVRSLDVSLRVGRVAKTVRVFGERRWRRFLWWWWSSRPEPFSRVPLTWENAFGGTDKSPGNEKKHAWDPRNPVGRGFRSSGSRLAATEKLLPHLEDPKDRLRRPGVSSKPAAFAPISPHWEPRCNYGGTYDEKWAKERVPLLPEDFDERFHHSAPPDLVSASPLRGDESVEIVGCSRKAPLAFRLPGARYESVVRFPRGHETVALPLETVLLDVDALEAVLVWKGMLRVHGEVPRIQRIEIAPANADGAAPSREEDD